MSSGDEKITKDKERDYAKEYREYHGKPKQRKRRSSRNKARRKMKKEGRVKDRDGKDVDHKDGNPLNNRPSNLRVTSRKRNRSKKAMHEQAIHLLKLAQARRAQTDVPQYRAHTDPQANCGLCKFFVRSTECDLYSFAADADYVCDSFAKREPDIGQLKAMVEKLGARNSRRDLTMLQQVHDLTSRLGAHCDCE